jgi:enoyl-CoA hydratase
MLETGDKRIELSVDGRLAVIRINRPEKLNALDLAMILALHRAATLIDQTSDIRCAIITGSGEKSFCAGGDIEAWAGMSAEDFALQWIRAGHKAFDALARLRVPLIAALNGHTLGGGFEVAITADRRIAEEHAKFGLPETGLGIIPGWSGTQRASRRFGSQIVKRMAMFGEVFTAGEAQHFGIVDRVVPKGQSLEAAREDADRVLSRGPLATQITKQLINAAEGEEIESAIEIAASLAAAGSSELKTGVEAFRAKRKPEF